MKTLELGFLVYLGGYRLALLTVAGMSILLGYRLFRTAFLAGADNATSIKAQAGDFHLTLRNAAPGTCFALFGAALAAGTAIWMPPGVSTYERLRKGAEQRSFKARGGPGEDQRDEAQSGTPTGQPGITRYVALKREGDNYVRDVNFPAAVNSYKQALKEPSISLTQASAILDELAWLGQAQAVLPLREVEALASTALGLDFGNPSPIHTLARVALSRGQARDALALAERALELSPGQPEFVATVNEARAAAQAAPGGKPR